MRRRSKVLVALAAAGIVAATVLGAGADRRVRASDGVDPGPMPSGDAEACSTGARRTTEIATAKLIIEYNATDDDLGIHGAFDDHGWRSLCVFDPTGRAVLEVGPEGHLLDLTMAGIFFESREPPSSEFSFADLRAAFPEGEYTVRGESFDGTTLVGSATFTHDVPAPPTITSPAIADEPRGARRSPVSPEDLVIRWDPVTESVDGDAVHVTGYEVIITKEVDDDPHGFSRPTVDVHVPPTVHRLAVPVGFLEPDTVYELEVLALEVTGNQTISVGFFGTI